MRVAQIAPAVRVSIGEMFGLSPGDYTLKLGGLLKALGFDEVIETPFGADIITYLEALEFERRMKTGPLPLFNSCCVGWREFALRTYPQLKDNISKLVSPMMAAGAITKLHFSKIWGKEPEEIEVVGIMPCTLKKHETEFLMSNGLKYVDEVITTVELGEMAKKRGINIREVDPYQPSKLSMPSKDGIIFGATGGISEAVMNNLARLKGEKLEIEKLSEEGIRGDGTFRLYKAHIGDLTINGAIVFGLPMIPRLMRMPEYKDLHFIEVMMCPFGCVGGPGQPPAKLEVVKERAHIMRDIADKNKTKATLELDSLNSIKNTLKENYGIFEYKWR